MPLTAENTQSPEPSSQTGAPTKEELLQKLGEAEKYLDRETNIYMGTVQGLSDLLGVVRFLVEENAQLKQDVKDLQRQSGGWG